MAMGCSVNHPARFRGMLRTTVTMAALAALLVEGAAAPNPSQPLPSTSARIMSAVEQQVTSGRGGRILTNTGVWSPDSEWIVYDTRSDPAGDVFDGSTIERVNVRTGEVQVLYRSGRGAHCGVATCHPRDSRVVFILGPEDPTPDWSYNAWHRRGVMVDAARPGTASNLDARDLLPPFTPGALRGGSHLHVCDAEGRFVSFTYEDHLLAQGQGMTPNRDLNQRNVGVTVMDRPVRVTAEHPRNHDGQGFSVLVTRTTNQSRPGTDDIARACEEGWVGTNGYLRPGGSRQRHALAFQGQVVSSAGQTFSEVFIVDLPEDLTQPGNDPLAGTETRRPAPPKGVAQRRLTRTAGRPYPGLQGPRHWLRSSPDGSQIAFLMKDEQGVAQLWTVSPNGGPPRQLTRNPHPVASAFTWSPDGRWIAHVMDNSVCLTDAVTGKPHRLTPRCEDQQAPRPEACVFAPDGRKIAFVRRMSDPAGMFNQVFVVHLK
jgi:hypothetical protein